MELSLKDIATLVGGTLLGRPEIKIGGVAGMKEAREGDITFLSNPKYLPFLDETRASAVLVGEEISPPPGKTVIRCKNPSLAFNKVVEQFKPSSNGFPKGIHPTAVLGKDVSLGPSVNIGPYAVVEEGVQIGKGSSIGAGSFIGHHSQVGRDTLIYPHVTIREETVMGDRVIIHSGTVIGSDGFGFETVDGVHHKIPQVGHVVIGDDVEMGANVTVDRARFGKTVIKKGTKIDNLVQVAHNVEIGEHCLIVAQVGISGTTQIGHHVIIGGQAGLVGHIEVGDEVIIAAKSGISKDVPKGMVLWGSPALPIQEEKRNIANVRRLGPFFDRVKELEKKVEKLKDSQ
ncbi:MAG: UDP-3-O-(3-hydroxymyristoyl)glucosamine N-acyltransferase [Chlamydiae bacterium]|nr:UDP-3-O-(3-hydroxymyristoyl)glucosamine N-acyltransferase [Chlamydiota bacterium]MBI3266179.1 UDP-3-O-(3-hydroxymyristoyl)glucosamine N-acyltransferase [Chlamydiota bacterium]